MFTQEEVQPEQSLTVYTLAEPTPPAPWSQALRYQVFLPPRAVQIAKVLPSGKRCWGGRFKIIRPDLAFNGFSRTMHPIPIRPGILSPYRGPPAGAVPERRKKQDSVHSSPNMLPEMEASWPLLFPHQWPCRIFYIVSSCFSCIVPSLNMIPDGKAANVIL